MGTRPKKSPANSEELAGPPQEALLTLSPERSEGYRMSQGEAEPSAAEVAAALTRVALALGGAWTITIKESGQLALTELDEDS
jgi:hypothetical protein